MFLHHVIRPFAEAFYGSFEHIWIKLGIFISGLPGIFAFDLFETPQLWWKGLVWLVIFDWVAGITRAVYRGEFQWQLFAKKWYMATGYVIVCSMGAILSNSFPNLFWFVQYIVYTTFFLKEFISTLKTFKVFALFKVMWSAFIDREIDIKKLNDFKKAVDAQAEKEDWTGKSPQSHEEN